MENVTFLYRCIRVWKIKHFGNVMTNSLNQITDFCIHVLF